MASYYYDIVDHVHSALDLPPDQQNAPMTAVLSQCVFYHVCNRAVEVSFLLLLFF